LEKEKREEIAVGANIGIKPRRHGEHRVLKYGVIQRVGCLTCRKHRNQ